MSKNRLISSLYLPTFRLLWINMFISYISFSIQNVLISWLVLDMTGSSLLFSTIMAFRFLPFIIAPFCGVIADRFDRRKLLIIFKSTQVGIALILGTLILGRQIQLWHVTVTIFILSIVTEVLNLPAESAFTVDVVGGDNLTNATALQKVSQAFSGFIGPSIVGAFVNIIGIGPFFYLNAAIYFVALLFLIMIRDTPKNQLALQRFVIKDFSEGFKYSWKKRIVLGGELISFFTNMFPLACMHTIMLVFARSVLKADASLIGWLTAGIELGSLIASFCIAFIGNINGKGKIAFISSLVWGTSWILFSLSPSFLIGLIFLIMIGISHTLTVMLANVILLINTDANMRGRITGIKLLGATSQFPGSIFAGAISEILGVSLAVGLEGGFFILSMLTLIRFVPDFKNAD